MRTPVHTPRRCLFRRFLECLLYVNCSHPELAKTLIMKTKQYQQWLECQKYQPVTIQAQIHRVERVEKYLGDLDSLFDSDQLSSVIESLRYTANDLRNARSNPTPIPIDGDLCANLASYRDAVKRYRKFLIDPLFTPPELNQELDANPQLTVTDEDAGQRIGLERDMQAALRLKIEQLESGLSVIDDGAERSVDSGFIDITARDSSGVTVVIELKTGIAGQRAVAQILSYMGDIMLEQNGAKVRGILVASDFDSRAKAAARMVPDLILRKYSVRFSFSDGAE
ncbi:MAG: Protein of unknown function DUF91 [Candidatus Nitrotoga sp. SPKER]|nr:MAG: Protein of unknown function DUF91 [Candidatus Nitrotoga sp. SPKER]